MSQKIPNSQKAFSLCNLKAILSILGFVIFLGLFLDLLVYSYVYDIELDEDIDENYKLNTEINLDLNEIFKELDTNNDEQLSFGEFLAYEKYYKIYPIQGFGKDDAINFFDFDEFSAEADGGFVTVECFFTPLVLSSLTKDVKHISRDQWGSLEGLLQWMQPFKKQHDFGVKIFSLFLPPKHKRIIPGETWWIVKSAMDNSMSQMSSSRHFPLNVQLRLRPLFALLTMFHPRPFLHTRFAPQGTVAILRAVGDDFLDIVFRLHAEFQLNEPPVFPFWFTPAQFRGRLIINKNGTVVRHFHLEVPNQRKLNVDMEWLNGPKEDSMEVDIGYIPEMMLSSKLHSLIRNGSEYLNDALSESSTITKILQDSWSSEISMQEAMDQLDLAFYPFKQIKYHNMTEAFQLASSESKLVHGIVLWGALDDQSC